MAKEKEIERLHMIKFKLNQIGLPRKDADRYYVYYKEDVKWLLNYIKRIIKHHEKENKLL